MAVKTWEDKYEIARSYYQEHGNLLVPDKHIYGGINLGNWIYLQRKAYKDGKLQENRISMLMQIGMVWDVLSDKWAQMYEVAALYYRETGSLLVNTHALFHGEQLGKWVSYHRMLYAEGKLSQERVSKLEQIGMIWDASKNNIASSFPEQAIFYYIQKVLACKYYEMHGNLMVGAKEQFEGENLGPWLKWQCTQRNALTTEQISALEAIGIVWHRNNAKWDTMFELASEYYAEHGNLLVNTHSLYKGQKLGQWINCMRIDYMNRETASQNEAFTLERMQKLESIGMVWDVREWQWEQMYAAAKAFYEQHGHLKVTIEYDSKLKKWLDNQRSAYRGYPGRKPITKDHEDKLTAIGMIW